MATRIKVRRGTAAQWAASNPTLADGEPGYATDTGILKVGDGATPWASLPGYVDEATAGATYVPFARLAANPDLLTFGTITRDANGAATSAPVVWPDGAAGTYTATTVSTAHPGAVDAYTVTRVVDGITTTYTQPAVTRDSSGAVTARPALTVA